MGHVSSCSVPTQWHNQSPTLSLSCPPLFGVCAASLRMFSATLYLCVSWQQFALMGVAAPSWALSLLSMRNVHLSFASLI